MNIAIFETMHFEGSYPVIKLFDTPNNRITVFAYENCFRQFKFLFIDDLAKFDWVIKKENDNKNVFILKMYREMRKRRIELLYLNTISDNYHSYSILIRALKGIRVIVTLHNINSYFMRSPGFGFKRNIKNNGKNWLLRSACEFNVVGLCMVKSLKSKLPSHKKVYCLPGAIFEKEKINTNKSIANKKMQVVVPGSVDVRRRNYEQVFEFLEKCNAIHLPVTLVLLGGAHFPEGKQIIKRCASYARQYDNLKFYETEVVDQPEFDRVMNTAHFVWSPSLERAFLEDGISEIYGETIYSGNIFDVIKHAVPFIIPEYLKVDEFIETSACRYSSVDDIIDYLERFFHSPLQYASLLSKAIENSGNYTIENIRGRNQSLFQNQG
ncbi:MAG: hypothetical protein JST47_07050 [Bacteroidetes bacterium]|nr:hypothetical protein [Bacteroidota bacterium]